LTFSQQTTENLNPDPQNHNAQNHNFSKIHKTEKNICLAKTKNTSLMILNDKPNCQVSRILINPRPIYVKRSENDS
jgi:hypothetical protein